jgi:hypothetical protein
MEGAHLCVLKTRFVFPSVTGKLAAGKTVTRAVAPSFDLIARSTRETSPGAPPCPFANSTWTGRKSYGGL